MPGEVQAKFPGTLTVLLTQSANDLSKVEMRLGSGEFLVGRRLKQILKTGHAIFEDEIEFALFVVDEIVKEANDIRVVHFAQQFDLHAHVVLAVGNLPQLTFLDDLHGFTTEGHAICKNYMEIEMEQILDVREVDVCPLVSSKGRLLQ